MREIEAITKAYDQAYQNGVNCVLATVVHVEGSSYRKAGARMLVDEYGNMTGAISGGCLEGDALKKALHALHQKKNKMVTYDTSDEEDAVIGAQLGCNGIIRILFEPIDPNFELNAIALLKRATESNNRLVIIAGFCLAQHKSQLGTIALMEGDNFLSGQPIDQTILNQIKSESALVLQSNQSHFIQFETDSTTNQYFLELYNPPPHLLIIGAGNDAQILAQMAELVGWKITIADGRNTHANKQRFTPACQVLVSKPEKILEQTELYDNTYVVLMSHNYQYDKAVLQLILHHEEIPYIGLLGPKSKLDRMLGDLSSEIPKRKIHSPIGLDLGTETPAEIALSIVAEIQSVINQTDVMSLADKNGSIHDKRFPELKTIRA